MDKAARMCIFSLVILAAQLIASQVDESGASRGL